MGLGIFRRVECDVESLNVAFDVLEVERSKTVVRTHERLVEYDFMQITWLIDRLGRMRPPLCRMRTYKCRIRLSEVEFDITKCAFDLQGRGKTLPICVRK